MKQDGHSKLNINPLWDTNFIKKKKTNASLTGACPIQLTFLYGMTSEQSRFQQP